MQPKDTLYSIAWRHDVDFRELAKWNNIGPDYRLSVGQVLVLSAPTPAVARAPAASRAHSEPRVGSPKPLAGQPGGSAAAAGGGVRGAAGSGAAARSGAAAGSGAAVGSGAVVEPGATAGSGARAGPAAKWLWPTEHHAPPRPVPGGGILLFGKLGQNICAAGSGRVVYTGSGIRGYGNLIIVKHGDNLLSSYAHNSEMLVHEGQEVVMGQIIAHMGLAAHQTSALYFEIRLNGKPVDPLRYLPRAE